MKFGKLELISTKYLNKELYHFREE